MNEQKPKWPGFKYEPVGGLVTRYVARYLRTQRKNMQRFFDDRGLHDLSARLRALVKDPTRSSVEKNHEFQRILNDYARRAAPEPGREAAPQRDPGAVAVPAGAVRDPGHDAVGSVPEVAS